MHVRWGEVAIMAMSRFKKKEEERVRERRRQGRGKADWPDGGGPRSQSHGWVETCVVAVHFMEASVTCLTPVIASTEFDTCVLLCVCGDHHVWQALQGAQACVQMGKSAEGEAEFIRLQVEAKAAFCRDVILER